MFQRLFGLIILTVATAGIAHGQQAELIESSGAWNAYKYTDTDGGLVCFVSSKPSQMEGNYSRRGPVWLQITHRQEPESAANKKNVVSFSAGFRFAEDHQPILTIGSDRFRMHTQDETAWSFPDDDVDLTRALRDGANLVMESRSWRGTEIRDTFSLSGVTAMHNLISEECGVTAL